MAAPAKEVKPADDGYAELLDKWFEQGRPSTIESMKDGWQYRAVYPDASAVQPTFVLVVYAPGTTTAALDGPDPDGYGLVMATRQRTWHGTRLLPKE